jgi:hypothetical protein
MFNASSLFQVVMLRSIIIASCGTGFLILISCSPPEKKEDTRLPWIDLVEELIDVERAARMDVPGAAMVSSYDRTGGNDDYNNPIRNGKDGWWVLADLEGPGYVSRLWTTGGWDLRFRWHIDGSREPIVDKPVKPLFNDGGLFVPPLSNHEQGCLYSYLPLPYGKNFLLESQRGGTLPGKMPKLYYQLSRCNLPPTHPGYLPMPSTIAGEDAARFDHVRSTWENGTFDQTLPAPRETKRKTVALHAGESAALGKIPGPAIVRRLLVRPQWDEIEHPAATRLLRDVVLTISWNGLQKPSVEVPMGDFFGSFWRRRGFNSMFLGMTNDTFVSRFPMPFAESALIGFRNDGNESFPMTVEYEYTTLPAWDHSFGYFHATWNRTGPGELGNPHSVARVSGSGKYVGCILSAVNQDPSWWILEGDEIIRKSEESEAGWRGTGLEDYFNGGWYYRNVLARPLSGLLHRSPFRTIQYRFHLPDPILFEEGVDVSFERGGNHDSKGWMESVGYYYLKEPGAAGSIISDSDRYAPPDKYDPDTFMLQVLDHERLGDYEGARARVEEFLALHPNDPAKNILEVRLVAYEERAAGYDAVREKYAAIAASGNGSAATQANMLMWVHQDTGRALLGAYCNAASRIFVDGKPVMKVDHGEAIGVLPIEISSGTHTLVVDATWTRQSPWVYVHLASPLGDVSSSSDGSWKWTRKPEGNIHSPDYDDSSWTPIFRSSKGPPEDPFFKVQPNAFVGMQSAGDGMPLHTGDDKKTPIVFRRVFTLN